MGERPNDLTLAERRLIQESVARSEHERELQEQRRRRFTWTAVGVAGVLLLFALLAWWQRNVAINQAVLARMTRVDAETERDRAEQAERSLNASVIFPLPRRRGCANAISTKMSGVRCWRAKRICSTSSILATCWIRSMMPYVRC